MPFHLRNSPTSPKSADAVGARTARSMGERVACFNRVAVPAVESTPDPPLLIVALGGGDPEIAGRSRARGWAPLEHRDRVEHAVQVLAVQLREQLAERDPLLAAGKARLRPRTGAVVGALAVALDEPFSRPISIARSVVRHAAVSDAIPGAPRTW